MIRVAVTVAVASVAAMTVGVVVPGIPAGDIGFLGVVVAFCLAVAHTERLLTPPLVREPCRRCKGHGFRDAARCKECQGLGFVLREGE